MRYNWFLDEKYCDYSEDNKVRLQLKKIIMQIIKLKLLSAIYIM